MSYPLHQRRLYDYAIVLKGFFVDIWSMPYLKQFVFIT